MLKNATFFLFFFLASVTGAFATPIYIVFGDSIESRVVGGTSSQLFLNIVSNERDVIFKNISSGGNSLGSIDSTGYNNATTSALMDLIGGAYSAYDGVIVMVGTNDFYRNLPWQDTSSGLRVILQHVRDVNAARGTHKRVLVMDPIYRSDQDTPNGLGYKLDVYRYFEMLLCTTAPSVPPSNPETGGFSDICTYGSRAHTVMGDVTTALPYLETTTPRVHPNVAGHRKMADWLELEAAAAGLF